MSGSIFTQGIRQGGPIRLSKEQRKHIYDTEAWASVKTAPYVYTDEDGEHTIEAIHLTDPSVRWRLVEGVLVAALAVARIHNTDGHPETATDSIMNLLQLSMKLSNKNHDAITLE